MNIRLCIIVIMVFQAFAFAQEEAWVYLADKPGATEALQNPITILTQQAINRKVAQGVAIDVRDVPVSEDYIAQIKAQPGIMVLAKSKWFNSLYVSGMQSSIEALGALPFVASVHFANHNLDRQGRAASPNDKFELEETLVDFNYGSAQNQVEMLNLNVLHEQDFTGNGIVIAVLDAGFPNVNTMGAFQRMRDNNRLLDGYDFVNRTNDIYAYTGSNHGTKVLSTMSGYIPDSYVGTAPDASYYLFRTENAAIESPVEESYWVEAAERADSLGVHIINTSLGYNTFDNPNYDYTVNDMDGNTTFISRGANIAAEKGILVVGSAGNLGNNIWQIVSAPADSDGVFTIGAVDEAGNYAWFSSRGSSVQPTHKPDVVAMGLGAAVINENNNIVYNNGTSFSSPIIAGAMACLMQALPGTDINQLKQLVRMSASQYQTPDYFLGFGIPDFATALNSALSVQEQVDDSIKFYPNPVIDMLYIHHFGVSQNVLINIFDLTGKLVLHKENSASNIPFDVSGLVTGIYFMEIKTGIRTHVFKLIKI